MGIVFDGRHVFISKFRESFSGLLLVLQHFMANEKLGVGENQRVVEASTRMAEAMGLGSDRIELLRSAVLLRDLSKLGITNDILYKAADMSRDEVVGGFRKPRKTDARTHATGNTLRRAIPLIVVPQILPG